MSVFICPHQSNSMGSPNRQGSPEIDLLSPFSAGSKKILRAFLGGGCILGLTYLGGGAGQSQRGNVG